MKKIEQLLEHAHNNEEQKFKDTFNTLRNSLNVWETNGGSPSDAVMLICGQLIDRYNDLQTVIGYYWKTSLTAAALKSPSGDYLNSVLKTLPNVIGCVQQHYGWEQVIEVAHVFLNSPDPAIASPIPQNVLTKVLIQALGKLRNTEWLEREDILQEIITIGKIKSEALVVTAVKHGNDELLLAVAETKGIPTLEAIFVACEWSEKLAEVMPVINSEDPSRISISRKNALRMFPIVSPFVGVEQILDCACVENPNINTGELGIFIKQVQKWDGQKSLVPSTRSLQQIDLILENFELPNATKHEDLLNKIIILCADKYPHAQHWRNRINRHKMLQEVGGGGQISNRKI